MATVGFREKSPVLQRVDQFRRQILREEHAKLTPEQQNVFSKMYPEGIDKISYDKLDWATYQCENTKK